MPYREFPTREFTNELIGGQANGAVVEFTFGSYDGSGEIATATSGFAGIIVSTAADNALTSLKTGGIFRLWVDAQSTNIAAMDPIKPTTDGHGVKAASDGDQFSAIALEASTTNDDCILVFISHGYVDADGGN